MKVLYSFAIHGYYLIMLLAAFFNSKARLWIDGRKQWRKQLGQWDPGSATFWFHAASLGEFEQGLPVMEEMKRQIPDCKILLTFYSPSGYEIRKNYQNADYVCYLPLDTWYNAKAFIELVKPRAVFFIKYEFWYFYLHHLYKSGIPVYLISGIFRPQQIFFRKSGRFFSRQLKYFTHFFLQDAASRELLLSVGIVNTSVTGDTRFDRVAAHAENVRNMEIVSNFCGGNLCLVAGSTWHPDEQLLIDYINKSPRSLKFIIAPHEINSAHINRIADLLTRDYSLYSKASVNNIALKQVLIIDNIGMLSSLYSYGKIAYIGGGFGKGIHNILEAAVFGMPVIFGPNYHKFREAQEMIQSGCAFPVHSAIELKGAIDQFVRDPGIREKTGMASGKYVMENRGASGKITQHILKNLFPS